jgi:Ni/Fe-hydrogenase subunit HybB-like protein
MNFVTQTQTLARTFFLKPMSGGMLAMIVIGGAGAIVSLAIVFYNLLTQGHSAFGTTYDVPWGLPIVTYVFFGSTSIGLTFVVSLATVFNFEQFYPIVKRCVWLAIVTVVSGFSVLALEIGHPFRMLWALPLSLQYHSPMWWMGIFYSAYLVLLLGKFLMILLGDWDSPLSRGLGIALFVSAVLAHGNLGALFGMMSMRPFWYDGLTSVYFLVVTALTGIAFAVFFTYLTYGLNGSRQPKNVSSLMTDVMPQLMAATLGIVLIFMYARTMNGLWANLEGLEVFYRLLSSPLFHLEIWVGLVLPFLVLLSPTLRRKPAVLVSAAVLVIIALFIGRYEYVIGGQLVPLFRGMAVPTYAEYTPSFTEWMLVVLGASATLFMYGAGEWLLNLEDTPKLERA